MQMSAHATFSQAELLASLPASERRKLLKRLTEKQATELIHDWRFWARPKQLTPPGDWLTWILRAGRGFGKTLTGAQWTHERALEHPRRIALVARNPAEARDVMIEGPSGILKAGYPKDRPLYESSKKRITWPNGSWATIYSDEEPDQLRGFSGDTAWIDELGKFKHSKEVWDNLAFGMREVSTDRPRRLITTTPRPIPVLRAIEKLDSTVVVVGSSDENRSNLDPEWFRDTIEVYRGTRTGRQEIEAEYLDDIPGALWTRAMIDAARMPPNTPLPPMKRIVIGVDPSGAAGEEDERSDEIGIVAAGLGEDDLGYLLGDYSGRHSPEGWAKAAVGAFDTHEADRIVAEKNFGGEMVASTIRGHRKNVPVKLVTASRGKTQRAEPIAALYERNRIIHVKPLPLLEDQLCLFASYGYTGATSPDRADAAIWALSDLMLKGSADTSIPVGIAVPKGAM